MLGTLDLDRQSKRRLGLVVPVATMRDARAMGVNKTAIMNASQPKPRNLWLVQKARGALPVVFHRGGELDYCGSLSLPVNTKTVLTVDLSHILLIYQGTNILRCV